MNPAEHEVVVETPHVGDDGRGEVLMSIPVGCTCRTDWMERVRVTDPAEIDAAVSEAFDRHIDAVA